MSGTQVSPAMPDLFLPRMRRVPYLAALLLLPAGSLASFAMGLWAAYHGEVAYLITGPLTYVAFVVVPLLLLSVRRLRDLDMPAWLTFVWLVPLLNVLLGLLLTAMPGTAGQNGNGAAPGATPRWVAYVAVTLIAVWITVSIIYLRAMGDAFAGWAG